MKKHELACRILKRGLEKGDKKSSDFKVRALVKLKLSSTRAVSPAHSRVAGSSTSP